MLIGVVLLLGACRTRRQMDELGNALGVLTPSAEGSAFAEDASIMVQLQRVARIAARHATLFGAPLAATLDRGAPVAELAVALDGGRCYSFVAVFEHAGATGTLRIEDPLGVPFAEARIDDSAHASGPHCPEGAGAYTVRLSADGLDAAQLAAIGVYRHEDPALLAMNERITARIARRVPDARPVGAVQRDAIEQGRAVEVPLVLAPGECRVVAGAAEGSGADFDFEVVDAGAVVLRDIGIDRDPVVGPFCVDDARVVRLRLRAYSRSGTIYWRSFSTEGGAPLEPPTPEATAQ